MLHVNVQKSSLRWRISHAEPYLHFPYFFRPGHGAKKILLLPDSRKIEKHWLMMLAPKAIYRVLQTQWAGKQLPDEYRVTFASKSFRSIYMIETELVIGALDDFREDIIWTIALAMTMLMRPVE